MEVSPRFSDVLPDLEDVKLKYFGGPSEFRHNKHDPAAPVITWEPIETIETLRRLRACFVSNITADEIPGFLSPELLEEIRFDGQISQLNFDQLVVPLENLRYLDIHLSSLEHLDLRNTLIQLNNLECLEISSTHFTYLHATNAKMEPIIDNGIGLLGLHFPALSYLALSVPALYSREDQWTLAIINCLFRHRTSLRYLNVDSPYPVLEDSNGKILSDPATAKDFDGWNGSLDQIHLRSFHYYALYRTSSTEFWRQFLLQQESLEYVQFWCDSPHKAASPKVIRNNPALHTVAINNLNVCVGNDGRKPRVNCASFQTCVNLKVIFLKGTASPTSATDPIPTTNSHVKRESDLDNFLLIPVSLEKVKIMNILMSMEQTNFLVTDLPGLKSLHLENIGEGGTLGLDFEDLYTLIDCEKMERVEVVRGINRKTLELSREDSGYKIIAKVVLQKQRRTWFRGLRNEEGLFEVIPDPEHDLEDKDEDQDLDDEDDEESELESNIHNEPPIFHSPEYGPGLEPKPEPVTAAAFSFKIRKDPQPGPSKFISKHETPKGYKRIPESVASSEFQEIQSIVDRLVDADDANLNDFLQ